MFILNIFVGYRCKLDGFRNQVMTVYMAMGPNLKMSVFFARDGGRFARIFFTGGHRDPCEPGRRWHKDTVQWHSCLQSDKENSKTECFSFCHGKEHRLIKPGWDVLTCSSEVKLSTVSTVITGVEEQKKRRHWRAINLIRERVPVGYASQLHLLFLNGSLNAILLQSCDARRLWPNSSMTTPSFTPCHVQWTNQSCW